MHLHKMGTIPDNKTKGDLLLLLFFLDYKALSGMVIIYCICIRDGSDIRKISDIRLIFQYPKNRRISEAKAPDIRLYISYHFLALEIHNRLYCRNFPKFVFLLLY